MTTKCYYIEDTITTAEIIKALEMAIPCFTQFDMLDDGYIEFCITCREADVQTVERYLAPIV